MAESLDDGEFWLPPKFLADDEDLFVGFGGFSDLSSPVESVVGSTETESDDDDFVAGLSLQMARSTVGDGLGANDKGWSLSGSPQSTLCSVGGGGASRVSAPPATWDLLYAAAGEVAKMRMNQNNAGFVAPPRNPSPVGFPAKPDGVLHYQRLQAAQFHFLKQQQLLRLQQQRSVAMTRPAKGTGHFQPRPALQTKPRNTTDFSGPTVPAVSGGGNCRTAGSMGLSGSAWPTLQRHVPGTRPPPPFHGGGKRECAGTGVFLPRRKVCGGETKKTACSMNLESQPQPQPRFNGSFNTHNDASIRARRSNSMMMNQEIRLPQEWTY